MPHLGCGEDAEDNENRQIKGKKFKQSKTDAFFLKNLKFCVIGEKKRKVDHGKHYSLRSKIESMIIAKYLLMGNTLAENLTQVWS